MADFTVRSDAVDVEEIMRQIRARIRDKRGVDYTEEQIQELANARLEKFLDPSGVRSDLLDQYRRQRTGGPAPTRSYAFEDNTLFESDKPIIRFFRRLLQPVLKLFFNYNVLNNVLHTQASINHSRDEQDLLAFEVMHNLVVEMTRTSIEVKALRMKLESVQSRLEFNERRARALEGVVQYKPEAVAAARRDAPPLPGTEPQGGVDPITGGESLRTKRRRRRRSRRPDQPGAVANGEAGASDDAPDTDGYEEPPAPSHQQAEGSNAPPHERGEAGDAPPHDRSEASVAPPHERSEASVAPTHGPGEAADAPPRGGAADAPPRGEASAARPLPPREP